MNHSLLPLSGVIANAVVFFIVKLQKKNGFKKAKQKTNGKDFNN